MSKTHKKNNETSSAISEQIVPNSRSSQGLSNSEMQQNMLDKQKSSNVSKTDMEFRLAQIQQEYLLHRIPFLFNAIERELKSERTWEKEQSNFSSIAEFFSSNKKPDVQRWHPILAKVIMARDCISNGKIEAGIRHYQFGYDEYGKHLKKYGRYISGNASGLDNLHTGMTITRDIAFVSAATIAGVVAAPVVAPMLFGSSVGVAGTMVTGSVIS
jgi:hypothetical protein